MNDILYHHGILGQKWGVRRFQKEDGSYTQAGLERYRKSEKDYNTAKDKYQTAKENKKAGTGSRREVKAAKREYKDAKWEHKHSYNLLKKDYLADKGQELYSQGKTLSSGKKKVAAVVAGTTTAATLAAIFLPENTRLVTRYGKIPINMLGAGAIATGGAAVAGILKIKSARQAKQLTTYYKRNGLSERPKNDIVRSKDDWDDWDDWDD